VVTIGAFRLSRFRIRSGCGGSARPLARRGRRWPAAWRTLARSAARAGLRCGGPPCPAAPGGRRRPLSAAGCRRRGFRWPGRRRAWRRRAWRPVANGTARPPRIGPASDMGRPAYGAAIKQRPHVPTDSYAAARNGSAALSVKVGFVNRGGTCWRRWTGPSCLRGQRARSRLPRELRSRPGPILLHRALGSQG